jgi:hypothetical protein
LFSARKEYQQILSGGRAKQTFRQRAIIESSDHTCAVSPGNRRSLPLAGNCRVGFLFSLFLKIAQRFDNALFLLDISVSILINEPLKSGCEEEETT